jgi:hypothetical protein
MNHLKSFHDINATGYEDKVQLVPVSELIKLREHDRRVVFKWSKASSDETIDTLKVSIAEEGLKNPLKLQYYHGDHKAYLAEGNHRLSAAVEMGLEYLPAVVVTSELKSVGDVNRVPGYASRGNGSLPSYLAPSEIGIAGCIDRRGRIVPVEYADTGGDATFDSIRHKLTDVVYQSEVVVKIAYGEEDYHKLTELFEYDGDMYDIISEEAPVIRAREVEVRYFDIFRHYHIDSLPVEYRAYLLDKFNEPETTDDFELIELLSEAGDTDYTKLKRLLYTEYEQSLVARERDLFTYTSYTSCYGGHLQLERMGERIVLELPLSEVRKFQNIHAHTNRLMEVLLEEFRERRYRISLTEAWGSPSHELALSALTDKIIRLL